MSSPLHSVITGGPVGPWVIFPAQAEIVVLGNVFGCAILTPANSIKIIAITSKRRMSGSVVQTPLFFPCKMGKEKVCPSNPAPHTGLILSFHMGQIFSRTACCRISFLRVVIGVNEVAVDAQLNLFQVGFGRWWAWGGIL